MLAVALPFFASALGARQLAAHHPSAYATDFAQPLVVVTAWGDYGGAAFAWLAGGIAFSALALAVMLGRIARDPRPTDRPAIYATTLLGLLGAFAWPFVFSSDVYAYAAYGALAEAGHDPYTLAPLALHEPFLDAARWQWRGPLPVDIYGPAMLALSRAAIRLTHGYGIGATLALLRLGAAGAFLASVCLLDLALRGVSTRCRALTLATYALNPVIVWSVAEGHNDAFVALALAGALLAARTKKPLFGGWLAGLLPALKATGLLFAIGFMAEAVRTRRARAKASIVATMLGLGIACAVTLPPLLTALGTVRESGHYQPTISAQGLLGLIPALALALGAAAWGARRLWAGERSGYAWIGIAALLALPNDYPWYALWLVPVALAGCRSRAATALGVATIFALVRYLPDALGTLTGLAANLTAGLALAPLAIALTEFGLPARRKKDAAST